MKFDDIIEHIGQFGPYQKRVYFLLCLPAISVAFQSLATVFTMGIPNHRCAIPGLPNDTFRVQSDVHEDAINFTIPREDSNMFSSCRIYDMVDGPYGGGNHTSYLSQSVVQTKKCHKWVYDDSQFKSTLISKLDLVCDKKSSKAHAQMFFMLGALIGSLVLAPPADFFGRKKTLMLTLILQMTSSFIISFSPSFIFLCVALFLTGGSGTALYTTIFVLGMELVGPKKRTYAGYVIVIFYGVGVAILAGLAYFIRDWQPLQLVISSFTFIFLSYYWLIPESPRWLISKERYQEAEVIIMKAARVNKKEVPTSILQWDNIILQEEEEEISEPIWRIVTYPRLLIRTLIIFLNWMTCSMAYFGLGLNVGDLAGSIYLNSLLYGAVESLSYVICMILLDRIGRRKLYLSCVFVAGIACTASPFPHVFGGKDYQWLTVVLAIVGKFGVSGAFGTIWVYTSELFPTVVRNSGVSYSSLCARLGGVISPYIANMSITVGGELGQFLPLVIFGGMTLLAGLLSLYLPETRDAKLPESLKDANEFGRKTGVTANHSAELTVLTSSPNGKESSVIM